MTMSNVFSSFKGFVQGSKCTQNLHGCVYNTQPCGYAGAHALSAPNMFPLLQLNGKLKFHSDSK